MIEQMALELYLIAVLLVVFIVDLFWQPESTNGSKESFIGWLTFGLLSIGLVLSFSLLSGSGEAFGGVYNKTELSLIFQQIFILSVMFCVLCSVDLLANRTVFTWPKFSGVGEYYLMLLFSLIGMCFLACAEEMLFLYISLELATIPLFILSCYLHSEKNGAEAGIKFLITGVLSSALLLYGLSLIYGAMGCNTMLDGQLTWDALAIVGAVFVFAGLGFKVTAVPFHLWAPDVYQGAPTPITAFLSVGSKTAGMVVLTKLFWGLLEPHHTQLVAAVAILAVTTMTWGNLVAIKQRNIKRFLAYSSISQAGYLLMAFLGTDALAVSALVFYLLVYLVTNIAAFSVVIAFENQCGSVAIESYRGFSKRNPVLALVLMLSLFSLAGIPPLPGFIGKFWLFAVAAKAEMYWLVAVAALNSTVSLYYYLQIVRRMYIMEPKQEQEQEQGPEWSIVKLSPALILSVAGSSVAMLLLVVSPQLLEHIHALAGSLQ